MVKAKAKPKKKSEKIPAKQYRYAVTRVPVHGEKFEFCGRDCQFLSCGFDVTTACSLDPTAAVLLERSKQGEYKRHKVCLESSHFVHMNIMRAKMEKMLGA